VVRKKSIRHHAASFSTAFPASSAGKWGLGATGKRNYKESRRVQLGDTETAVNLSPPAADAKILEIGQDCSVLGQPGYVIEKISAPF